MTLSGRFFSSEEGKMAAVLLGFGALVLIFAGCTMFYVALFYFRRVYHLRKYGVEVTGEVIDLEAKDHVEDGVKSVVYLPTIRFIDQEGKERIYKPLLAPIRPPKIGEKVPLRYVPRKSDIVSDSVGFETAMIVLYIIASSMVVWLGVWILKNVLLG
jgi:hypothetical protein